MLTAAETDAGRETIFENEVLSQTTAAKTGRVYKTPNGGYVWDSPATKARLPGCGLQTLLIRTSSISICARGEKGI